MRRHSQNQCEEYNILYMDQKVLNGTWCRCGTRRYMFCTVCVAFTPNSHTTHLAAYLHTHAHRQSYMKYVEQLRILCVLPGR